LLQLPGNGLVAETGSAAAAPMGAKDDPGGIGWNRKRAMQNDPLGGDLCLARGRHWIVWIHDWPPSPSSAGDSGFRSASPEPSPSGSIPAARNSAS
jgi:hypothetical protein